MYFNFKNCLKLFLPLISMFHVVKERDGSMRTIVLVESRAGEKYFQHSVIGPKSKKVDGCEILSAKIELGVNKK